MNVHKVVFHNPTNQKIDSLVGWSKKTENTKSGKVTHLFERSSNDNAGKMEKLLTKVSDFFSKIKSVEKSSRLAKLTEALAPNSNTYFGPGKFNPNVLVTHINSRKDDSDLQDLINDSDKTKAVLNEHLTAGKYQITFDNKEYKP